MVDFTPLQFLDRTDGARLAYRQSDGDGARVGLIWLGGHRSDMEGQKAASVHAWAISARRAFVRFDYFGHGSSDGLFEDGTIGRWRADALAVIDELTDGPQVLVGSSMGGWIALLAALARPDRVAGLLLIAPAPDFTERLIIPNLTKDALEALDEHGVWRRPSDYDPAGDPITSRFLDEARAWRVLADGALAIDAPTRVLHGLEDADVPWRLGLETAEAVRTQDVEVTLVKGGDHRLSRPEDLDRLARAAAALCAQIDDDRASSAAKHAANPSR